MLTFHHSFIVKQRSEEESLPGRAGPFFAVSIKKET
jgi:hypothetical protein